MKTNSLIDNINEVIPGNEFFVNKYESVLSLLDMYGIQTAMRKSAFLAQIAHESGGFRAVEENLNYSSDRMLVVFPKYFNKNESLDYHRNPQRIANRVYANRMGNGNEASGDGWRYRGRGLIQLTGKNNYQKFSDFCGVDVIINPDYLTTPMGAMYSAIWFWDVNGCNTFADKGDIVGLTKKINGGINGLDHRKQLYDKFLPLMNEFINNLSIGDDTMPPMDQVAIYTVEQAPIVIDINDPLPDYKSAAIVPVIQEPLPDISKL
ncbi:MAG: glycoside hydrolase family 19 protein [Candidatus Levybacteria bacterium]|nr:glycoside hydrolase family 19 protein [Candidatus Levybacteria bacterium]